MVSTSSCMQGRDQHVIEYPWTWWSARHRVIQGVVTSVRSSILGQTCSSDECAWAIGACSGCSGECDQVIGTCSGLIWWDFNISNTLLFSEEHCRRLKLFPSHHDIEQDPEIDDVILSKISSLFNIQNYDSYRMKSCLHIVHYYHCV